MIFSHVTICDIRRQELEYINFDENKQEQQYSNKIFHFKDKRILKKFSLIFLKVQKIFIYFFELRMKLSLWWKIFVRTTLLVLDLFNLDKFIDR